MSVVTVPRISATEALTGVSSLTDLDGHDGIRVVAVPFEVRTFKLAIAVLLCIPWIYVGAFAAVLTGR